MYDARVDSYAQLTVRRRLRPTAWDLVTDAMDQIDRAAPGSGQALSLLALRRYLRIQEIELTDLASIWSWTAQAMQQSVTDANGIGRRLMNEAAVVQRAFARANPGYSLSISPPRDLERQVFLWTTNRAIRTEAERVLREATQLISQPQYVLPPTVRALDNFIDWLQGTVLITEPGNAAPGTSSHGRMQAIDFVVMQGGAIVADTVRSTIPMAWTAPGWTQRLATAVAGTQLVGPLAHPYEPWHWSLP